MHPLLLCLALFAITGWARPVRLPNRLPQLQRKPPRDEVSSGHSASNDAAIEKTIRAKLAASKISTNNLKSMCKAACHPDGRTDILSTKHATRLAKNGGASQW